MLKKALKLVLILVLVLALVVGGYAAYVFLTYHRIEDRQSIDIQTPENAENTLKQEVSLNQDYKITCYNIGFGAYTADYTFFMDGGSESRAASKESVQWAVSHAGETILKEAPDFAIFEEVDDDADRSWHVNEVDLLQEMFHNYYSSFAVNYDSAYLFYPVNKPIGKSHSGIVCFSRYPITSSLRRSLPIETGFGKFFDLDRCYSVNRVPVENGKELVIYAFHLSAYSSDPAVRDGQLSMLLEDMASEYAKGNYVIAGGDLNHDLKAEGDTNLTMDWAHYIDRSMLPEGISLAFDHLTDQEQEAFLDTTRNTDIAYIPEVSYTVTIDGFLISDNVSMLNTATIDTQFQYSDHNPVEMTFQLK